MRKPTRRRGGKACSQRSKSGPEDVQPVAADLQLVTVAKGRPLDAFAVHEKAVEAAIVKCSKLVLWSAHDEGMAARYGRIVESQIGCGAPADPGPAGRQIHDHRLAVLLVGDVAPGLIEALARLVQPGG